jgi:HAD superfamily hydrolase (TIGR01509 family)
MKAVIFDMDGVLVLTERMGYEVAEKVCKRHGFALNPEDYNRILAGRRTAECARDYLKEKGGKPALAPVMVREFREMKREILRNRMKQFISVREGSRKMLNRLQGRYRLALATSTIKEFTDIMMEGFGLGKFFEVMLTAEDVSKGKPDPEIYLQVAGKLGLEPGDCAVVEDSPNGIRSAKNAGMACIAVRSDFFRDRDLSEADAVIEGFDELTPELVEKITKGEL